MDVVQKRAEAQKHKGVGYDARSDRFTAEVQINGTRKWLGSYLTAQEAADAYAAAKQPVQRRSGLSAAGAALQELLDASPVDAKGRRAPEDLADMEVNGRVYTYYGTVFRRIAGRTLPLYEWGAACSVCGENFAFTTPANPQSIRGMRANCDEHKRGAKPKDEEEVPRVRRTRNGTEVTPEWEAERMRWADMQDIADLL